jgi:hypothetical protein
MCACVDIVFETSSSIQLFVGRDHSTVDKLT